uniref:Uncharacterized protein n=1 Tax=Arundo donax TaxID=35708 RepID=A0A0A9GMY7_ARUDO
MRSASAVD